MSNEIKKVDIDGEECEVTTLSSLQKSITSRNFGIYCFTDMYGKECSLQDSSLATESAIWFGVDKPDVKTFRAGEGWKDFPLPDDIHISGRMHLTQEQVKALLPILTYFAETGDYIRNFGEEQKLEKK